LHLLCALLEEVYALGELGFFVWQVQRQQMLNISSLFCSRVSVMKVICTHHHHLTYYVYTFSYAIEVFPYHRDNMKAFALANQHMTCLPYCVRGFLVCHLLSLWCEENILFYFTFPWPYHWHADIPFVLVTYVGLLSHSSHSVVAKKCWHVWL
jgi:hypothetical protein